MPAAKPIKDYPWQRYWALFQHVADTRKTVRIPAVGIKAMSLRGELYAWKRACRKNEALAVQLGIDLDKVAVVAMRIEGEDLVLEHHDASERVKLLVEAMRAQGIATEPHPEGGLVPELPPEQDNAATASLLAVIAKLQEPTPPGVTEERVDYTGPVIRKRYEDQSEQAKGEGGKEAAPSTGGVPDSLPDDSGESGGADPGPRSRGG
jgi:hypothetical protein